MNLISCTNCAVILDKDKIKFPKEYMLYNYEDIDTSKAEYDDDTGRYRLYVPCPVCKTPIFGEEV